MSPRRAVHLPLYGVLVLVFAAVLGPVLSIWASVQIAERNAAELLQRYQVDQVRTEAANRSIYCTLFKVQLDAFDEQPPSSATGVAIQEAWLAIYRLARCEPPRE